MAQGAKSDRVFGIRTHVALAQKIKKGPKPKWPMWHKKRGFTVKLIHTQNKKIPVALFSSSASSMIVAK